MLESFLPSRDGFAFVNAWPTQPAVVLPTPLGPIRLGDASAGLCGGMVFSALDYWHADLATPPERPAPDDPLYGFLVRRLVDSWHVPAGIVQYYQWMSLPDGDRSFTMFGRRVLIERGVCWRTIKVQWPQISTDLDRGVPVPLGVVTVASTDPRDLALNHQVLAFGYSVTGTRKTEGRGECRWAPSGAVECRSTPFSAPDCSQPAPRISAPHGATRSQPGQPAKRRTADPAAPNEPSDGRLR